MPKLGRGEAVDFRAGDETADEPDGIGSPAPKLAKAEPGD
jgi:hypothetical protein